MIQRSVQLRLPVARIAHASALVVVLLLGLPAGCGGGSSNSVPHQESPPTQDDPPPPEDEETPDLRQARLLSDAELGTPPIIAAAGLAPPTDAEQTWLAENAHPIRSIVYAADFSDLEFFAAELEGKRIVQLGESSHGSAEFSAIKVRLIKYLHESLGFNVIAFESSLVGCHLQDLDLDAYPPAANTGVRCAFGVWNTHDLNELAIYIRATRQTPEPLRLAGFDVQESGSYDRTSQILAWVSPILDRVAPGLTAPVRDAFITSVPGAANLDALETLSSQLRVLVDATPPTSPDRREVVFVWLALDFLHDRLVNSQHDAQRDSMMATNITRLAELAYPDDNIIVWAHNAHIANHYPFDPEVGAPMGSYLRARWGDQLATIGLFMLRGVSALNDRTPLQVEPPLPDSLEAYAYSVRLAALYLPIAGADGPGRGDDWLYRPTASYNWGSWVQVDTLAANYDGVIVIDHSSMPHYNF